MSSVTGDTHSADLVMARAGKTFHQAARLLPLEVRDEVTDLYAFCRTVDDLADDVTEPMEVRRAKLLQLAEALEAEDTRALPLFGTMLRTDRRRRTAARLVRAALADLRQQQPADDEAVLAYAFGVAGTVGLLMADLLGAQPAGTGAAVALGLAMQLSNISRDVAEDLGAGRVYLPQDRVSAAEVHRALLLGDSGASARVRAATCHLLALAEGLYQVAFDGMWSLPWRIRWSILAAALCYREIGVAVAADVERSWQRRAVVSRRRKLWLIAVAAVRLLEPRFWRPKPELRWSPRLGRETERQMRHLGASA